METPYGTTGKHVGRKSVVSGLIEEILEKTDRHRCW